MNRNIPFALLFQEPECSSPGKNNTYYDEAASVTMAITESGPVPLVQLESGILGTRTMTRAAAEPTDSD